MATLKQSQILYHKKTVPWKRPPKWHPCLVLLLPQFQSICRIPGGGGGGAGEGKMMPRKKNIYIENSVRERERERGKRKKGWKREEREEKLMGWTLFFSPPSTFPRFFFALRSGNGRAQKRRSVKKMIFKPEKKHLSSAKSNAKKMLIKIAIFFYFFCLHPVRQGRFFARQIYTRARSFHPPCVVVKRTCWSS